MKKEEPIVISDRTKLKTSVGIGAGIIGAVFTAGWGTSSAINKFSSHLDQQFAMQDAKIDKIAASIPYKVSEAEFSSWMRGLDDENRQVQRTDGKQGLVVPNLDLVR